METLKSQIAGGADFGTIARDFSDGNEAGKGGDIGWVAQGLIDGRLLRAIVATPVGGLSEIVDDRERWPLPLQGPRRADAEAGRGTDRHDQGAGIPELVRREEGRADDHPRAPHRPRARLAGAGRARRARRGGAAPLGPRPRGRPPGRRRGAPDRDAARAVPAGAHRPAGGAPRGGRRRRRRRSRSRCPAGTARPAATRSRVLRRPLPGRSPGRAVRGRRRHDRRRARRRRPRGAALPRAGRARAGRREPVGDALDLRPAAPARTAARGTASRPTSRSATTSSRRPTRSTTRSAPGRPRPSPTSSATCCSRSSSTRSSPPRTGVFDLADVHAAIASKIVRRHPHVFGDAEVRTASDVNRQWERIKADERADAADGRTDDGRRRRRAPSTAISRSLPALAASQEMQERAANIGYDWPTIDGVLDKVTEEARGAASTADVRRRAGRGVRRPAVRPRQRRAQAGHRGRGRAPRRERQVPAAIRVASSAWPPRVASRCATSTSPTLDELWDAAKAEEKETVR